MDSYKLDSTDIKILNLLQRDGLMTYQQLSEKLHKARSPIARRVMLLQKLGYIKNTVALIDVEKIKSMFTAFPLIQLTNHSEETLRQFQQEMLIHPEVMECYHVTGQYDFVIKIMLPSMGSYNEFIRKKISTLPYVGNIQSFLVLAETKRETAYEL